MKSVARKKAGAASALLTFAILATSLVVAPAVQAANPNPGGIPTCPGPRADGIYLTGNCLLPPGGARDVTPEIIAVPTELTPAGIVRADGLVEYHLEFTAHGQGGACPHGEPTRQDLPCQHSFGTGFLVYDPTLPSTGHGSLAGIDTIKTQFSADQLKLNETITLNPALKPDGATLITTASYAEDDLSTFDAGEPHPPLHFSHGFVYQVVVHLMSGPPAKSPVDITIEPNLDRVAPTKGTDVNVVLKSTGEAATVKLDTPLAVTHGLFEITPPPDAGGTFSVPAGGATKITFKLKAGATKGLDELKSEGKATDTRGVDWPLNAKRNIEVGTRVVQVVMSFDPASLTLDETVDGPVPKAIVLHTTIENVSAAELTHVKLLLEKPGWQSPNPRSRYFPSDVVVVKDPVKNGEYAVEDLSPGKKVVVDIPVIVKDDGHIEWGALLSFTRAGKTEVENAEKAKLTSIPKYLARFELKPRPGQTHIVDASIDDVPGEPWNTSTIVKAGESFALLGEVENRTTDQVIMAELPTTGLKNVNSAVFRGADTGAGRDVYSAGLPYRETIDPGSTQVVASFPSTVENETFGAGETFSARLTVVPKAAAPNNDGSYGEATADKVLTPTDLTVSAATMTPPVPLGPNADESYLGRFAIGYTEGGIKFVKGTAETVGWVVSKIPEIPSMTASAAAALVEVGSRLANGIVAVGTELYQMTPAERLAFVQELGNEAVHFALVKVPDMTGAAKDAIINMTNRVVEKLIYAVVYDPDPGAFWQSLGSFTSQAVGEISVGWLTDAAIAKVFVRLKEARGFKKAEAFLSEQAKAVGLKLEKGLAGIKPGTLITDRMLALGMGITKAQKDYMIEVARKWGVNIYARSRGAKAIELIQKGLATVKPYFIKPKSVNDIDKLFLGFEKLESDVVAIRKPPNWETVSAKMDGFVDPSTGQKLTDEQRNLVVDRWQKRNKEWFGDKGAPGRNPVVSEENYKQSYKYDLEQRSGKVQNLTLETEGNLEDAYQGKAFQVKPTKFQLVASAADPEALIPQLFENGWKVIVGDIDLVAITLPSGRVPSIDTLIAIYEDLQKPPLDLQHSATLTWLNEGAATAMLKDHLGDAAEPLIEASVSSRLRAVQFDPKMSFTNGDYTRAAKFIHLAGGEINAPRNWAFGGALTVVATNAAHQNYVPPSVYPADMTRNAPPTRLGANGPETLVNGVWVPKTTTQQTSTQSSTQPFTQPFRAQSFTRPLATRAAAAQVRLAIGVQTAVHETVPTGTTHLPILNLDTLYPTGSTGQGWFKAGDEVIIDPGTPAAFHTKLTAVGDQLTLADPLPAEVLRGTMVAMVPAPRDATNLMRNIFLALGAGLAALIAFLLLAKHGRPARIVSRRRSPH